MDQITIQELLKGKETIIKNKEFYSTKYYIEPFLERMSKFTTDFRVDAKVPDQLTKTKEKSDITYNRVLIQAVLPKEHTIDKHDEVIGFLYGIDVRKPVVKIYRGYLNQACTNLCVFNPKWINVQELLPGEPINFSPIKELLESQSDIPQMIQKLKSTYFNREEQTNYLGKWVDHALREAEDYGFGKVKIAVSTPVDAYKSLFLDQNSTYYIPEGYDPTYFDVYGALTQILTNDKKDIMNKFEKTMIVNKLLELTRI